ALRHHDSMGNGSIIAPGDLQRMTAGTGVLHSEQNATDSEPVHFLQIWIEPERQRLHPAYEQRAFPAANRSGRLTLLASHDRRDGSLTPHQDADPYSALFEAGNRVSFPLRKARRVW